MKKTLDLIISRIMLLVVVLVAPMFSFLAGVVWWVSNLLNPFWEHHYHESKLTPTFMRRNKGKHYEIFVVFLQHGFRLFKIPKIKRSKSGSIS